MSKIYGSGGGKGGGDAPKESPDSLRSRQKARIIEVLSEGEIVGLVNGLKSVYLNDVPVQNADNSYNYADVTMVANVGTQSQDYIPGFSGSEAETGVGVKIVQATPYIISVPARSSSGADAIRLTMGVPGLSFIDDKGNVNGTSVALLIHVEHNGGGYVQKVSDTISGKTTSRYQRNYRVSLPQGETGPWNVRITRVTANSASAKLVNDLYIDSYTLVSELKMRYTNSAIVGLEINAERFSSIPVRGYHAKGLKIKVPTNYNPTTRVYTGLWNGTFQTLYSNNPAWVMYDLLTQKRYGLGRYIDEGLVNKWNLYTVAQYCDALVPNGFGGTEPRYICNLYMQSREAAFKWILNMASIFHAAAYGSGGGIDFVQDAPRDPMALYSPANVIEGIFEYSGASIKARHNVALVSWNDPADMYRQKIEYVEDPDDIALYGLVQTEVVAMGCSSRGQARRFGRAILYAEKYESEGIAFTAGLDTYKVHPGAVFNVADPTRAQVQNGGRLLSATTTSIIIDRPVTIASGVSHTLRVVLPDGSVQARAVSSSGVGLTTLTVSVAFAQAPLAMAMWVIEAVDKPTESWVCLSVTEDAESGNIAVVGMAYRPEKFALIDADQPLPPTPAYNPYLASPPPTALIASVYLSNQQGLDLLVSWVPAKGTRFAKVAYALANENYTVVDNVYSNTFTIPNVSIGTYTILVITINGIGVQSPEAQLTYSVVSAAVLPDVTGLALQQPFVDRFASFIWTGLTTADSYRVQILVAGVVKRDVTVTDKWFIYDYAESVADGAGTPIRAFDIRVKAKFGTLESGNWLQISAANAAPAAPSVSVTALPLAAQVVATLPAGITDYAGMIVWASTTIGFTPSDANKVFDGVANIATINGFAAGIPLYVRVAFYDVFGKTSLNATSEITITPYANSADVPVVSTLPGAGTHEGQVVYLTTDDKLYRWAYDGLGGTVFGWRTWTDGSDLLAASVTAGKITTTNLAAISANLGTITAGNMTLDASGFIKGGQTAYNTGTGFWLGYNGAAYKFSLGEAGGTGLLWDGVNLSINGGGTFTGALSAATGTFAGSLSAATGTFAGSLSAATGTFAGSLSAATGTFAGSLSAATGTFGALTVAAGGNIKLGQTAYNTGAGFWLGSDAGTAKFSLGNPAGNFMRWTGTVLEISNSTNSQTFSANGTWTKPAFGTMALIEVWGGGGSGGGGTTTGVGSGGGGGQYSQRLMPLISLGATVTVVVGAGGAAPASAANGNPGVESSFGGTIVIALGGGRGLYSTTFPVAGGAGGNGANGGAGGTATNSTAGLAGAGTAGGGGGHDGAGASKLGGIGPFGNNGGRGGSTQDGTAGVAGTAPGSGGGGAAKANIGGGAGAAGRCVVTVF